MWGEGGGRRKIEEAKRCNQVLWIITMVGDVSLFQVWLGYENQVLWERSRGGLIIQTMLREMWAKHE
jgi:hypothetical protein